jgi:hypothetical protein
VGFGREGQEEKGRDRSISGDDDDDDDGDRGVRSLFVQPGERF